MVSDLYLRNDPPVQIGQNVSCKPLYGQKTLLLPSNHILVIHPSAYRCADHVQTNRNTNCFQSPGIQHRVRLCLYTNIHGFIFEISESCDLGISKSLLGITIPAQRTNCVTLRPPYQRPARQRNLLFPLSTLYFENINSSHPPSVNEYAKCPIFASLHPAKESTVPVLAELHLEGTMSLLLQCHFIFRSFVLGNFVCTTT